MRDKPGDKMRRPRRDKIRVDVDDFTLIPGVPAFVEESLYNQGILTFAQLREADLHWLHPQVQAAIERWRDG